MPEGGIDSPKTVSAPEASRALSQTLPPARDPEGHSFTIEGALKQTQITNPFKSHEIKPTAETKPEPRIVPSEVISPESIVERVGHHKGVAPSAEDLKRVEEMERKALASGLSIPGVEDLAINLQVEAPPKVIDTEKRESEFKKVIDSGSPLIEAIKGRGDAVYIVDPETGRKTLMERDKTEMTARMGRARFRAMRSLDLNDQNVTQGLTLEELAFATEVQRWRWKEADFERLEFGLDLEPDTRDRARLVIQFLTSLPVEGWKNPTVYAAIDRAYKEYRLHVYGVKDLEARSPEDAERLITYQQELIDLNLRRGEWTAAEAQRFNQLSAEFTDLRGSLSEIQREITDQSKIDSLADERLQQRESKELAELKRGESIAAKRRDRELTRFITDLKEEQRKKETDPNYEIRTYDKILEELREFENPAGARNAELRHYKELMIMRDELEPVRGSDPDFATYYNDVVAQLATPEMQAIEARWTGLQEERDRYLVVAEALGVTSGIAAQVEGYYKKLREEGAISRGDLRGFAEFVDDLTRRGDAHAYVSRVIDQRALINQLGLRGALGVRASVVQDMLAGTIKDYADDAKIELEVHAGRLAAAADNDKPLAQIIAEDPNAEDRQGRFNPAGLENKLRLEALGQMRRRIIESRTYQSVGDNVKDKDLPKFDRNDYNYLVFFATSESELQEALQDYVLFRASAEARWDVNEILQDVTRIEQLLVGFKSRFGISPENFDRYTHETDGILKSLVGDHYDHLGDEKTIRQVGNAFVDTYGAQRTERAYEGGEGMNAYILDQRENNPIYGVLARLDGLRGENHNDHPSQRQLYGDVVEDLAHRVLGSMLRAPQINQNKLGLDVPRSEFLKLYWEDIYREGVIDLPRIEQKIAGRGELTKEERWVCELLIVHQDDLRRKVASGQRVSDREIAVVNDNASLIEAYWDSLDLGNLRATIYNKLHSGNPADRGLLSNKERESYDLMVRLFGREYAEGLSNDPAQIEPELHKDEKQVLNYLIAKSSEAEYQDKLHERNGQFIDKDGADDYEILYWISHIQQKIVNGKDLTTEEKKIKEWFYDPQVSRMKSQVQLALAFEGFMGEAVMRTSSSFVADNGDYVPDEGIYDYMHVVRHLLEEQVLAKGSYSTTREKINILKGHRERFEEIWDIALETVARQGFEAKMDLSRFGVYADANGNAVFEDTGRPFVLTYERARKHPGKLWTMDTYLFTEQITRDALVSDQNYADAMARRFMLPTSDENGNRVEIDDVAEGAYILPRNLWILDPQGKILDPNKRDGRSAGWFEEEVSKMVDYSARKHFWITRRVMRKMGKRPPQTRQGQYSHIPSTEPDPHKRITFTLDERGRYVVEHGEVEMEKFDLHERDNDVNVRHQHRHLEGVVLERDFTGYLVEVDSDKNPNRVVLKDNQKQTPSLEERVRIGDENISAGLARKRLTKIAQYVSTKGSRWARFRELSYTLPSMILPDHRVHGGLDMRSGVAVIKTESARQRDSQNKRMDFLIQGGNNFDAIALQGQFYRRYMDGPGVEGEWWDPFSAKPTKNGDNTASVHHDRGKVLTDEGSAIRWRDNVRDRMKNFETGGAELFYRQQATSRSGMGASLARLMQDTHVIDAFKVLMTQGVDRDYKAQKYYWEFLFANAQEPIGPVMDSAISQMTRGVTNEIIDGVAEERYFKRTILRPYVFDHNQHKWKKGSYKVMDELF